VTDDTRIYVDAAQPATLNDGAGKQTDCASLQEAVLAWRALPSTQKIRATVKVIGGPDRPTALRAEAAGLAHKETAPLQLPDAARGS
jgi:hypothetical protein